MSESAKAALNRQLTGPSKKPLRLAKPSSTLLGDPRLVKPSTLLAGDPRLVKPSTLLAGDPISVHAGGLNKIPGTTGLSNLGNTCFMNSALQCLSNTTPLTAYFLQGNWKDELNCDNPLGMGGQVPKAYSELVHHLWNDSPSRASCYAPRHFKHTIGQLNSTFQGYGQQDSHELLQSLLDGLHEDLNRIKKKEYVQDPDKENLTEQEFASVSWEAYRRRNDSIIVDLFQAQLRNRTECQECGHESIKFDPYMYLQVPLPDARMSTLAIHLVLKHNRPFLVHVTLPMIASIEDLKSAVMAELGIFLPPSSFVLVEVWNCKVYKTFHEETVSDLGNNDVLYLYDVACYDETFAFHITGMNEIPDPTYLIATHSVNSPSSYSSGSAQFGIPLAICVPNCLAWNPPISPETMKESVGDSLYTLLVREVSRFSHLPLFRRKSSQLTLQDVCQLSSDANEQLQLLTCFTQESEEWEPLPHLFNVFIGSAPSGDSNSYQPRKQYQMLYPLALNMDPSLNQEMYPMNREYPTQSVQEGPVHYRNSSVEVEEPRSPVSVTLELTTAFNAFPTISGDVPDNEAVSFVPTESGVLIESEQREDPVATPIQIVPENQDIWIQWDPQVAAILFGPEFRQNQFVHKQTSGPFGSINHDISETKVKAVNEHMKSSKLTLQKCMQEFSKEEILDGSDSMYCSNCKDHRTTKKKLEVWSAPEILVIHLKRFSSSGRMSSYRRKIEVFVDAPLEGLDMRPLLVPDRDVPDEDLLYDLYAVSNHFGGLGGGHYNQWYNCDDSSVSLAQDTQIVTEAAYLLLYKKRTAPLPDLAQAIAKGSLELEREAQFFRSQSFLDSTQMVRQSDIAPQAEPDVGSSAEVTAENSPKDLESFDDIEPLHASTLDRDGVPLDSFVPVTSGSFYSLPNGGSALNDEHEWVDVPNPISSAGWTFSPSRGTVKSDGPDGETDVEDQLGEQEYVQQLD